MKIICTKNDLLKGVNIALRAVPVRSTMSILECILIDARETDIKLTANDMELGIETSISGDIIERGRIAIEARFLSDIVRKLPDSDKPSVAIVGSRQASQYGMMVAARLAYEMSSYGIQIISGMAVGIDTAAHKGTLDNSGYTCAVLGSGVDICYPACNIGLFTDIKKTGGVMSEYPAGVKPVCGQFPERNRLISGLSDAVVVVEARAKSGSLITVDQALEQNKDVYVIPGRVGDSLSEGCNELIKSGAYIMTKAEDILECDRIKNKLSGINGIPEYLQKLESVSQFELATPKNMVYSCVDLYPVGINELINKTGLSLQTVSGALVELELEGKIKETAHNCYARV